MREVIKLERGRSQSFRTYGDTWQTNSDAWKEYGVSKNCDTEEIDERCRVPHPCNCELRISPFRRLGFHKRWGDWPPAFNRPLTEQMPEPAPHSRSTRDWLLRC